MDRSTWYTKEDVLKDLEVTVGHRVADVDDSCFVVGDRPPLPRLPHDEDAEIELLFGQKAPQRHLNRKEETGPDLKAITAMIRMVQAYEHSSAVEDTMTPVPNEENVIFISKLNPNVKEFIPKVASSQNEKTIASKATETTDCDTLTVTPESHSIASVIIKKTLQTCNTSSTSDILDNGSPVVMKETYADDAKIEAEKETKKQMVIALKNKISAKSDTFEQKRETNFAIVNLLKLYAKPERQTERAKPIRLYTPDFFANCKASEFKSDFEDTLYKTDCSLEKITSLPSVDKAETTDLPSEEPRHENDISVKEIKTNDSPLLSNDNNEDKITKHASSTPADDTVGDNVVIPPVVVENIDSDVAESIDKVNKWLYNEPSVKKEKPKGPALYLGPVSYKRKDSVTCKSPSEVGHKKILKPCEPTYKPSKYAEELLKKYIERTEEKTTPSRPPTMWEKLEEDLKKRDVEVKNRKNKQN